MNNTDHLQEIRDAVRTLCNSYGEDYWRELDSKGGYPTEFVKDITDSGFLGCLIPEEYGGSGLPLAAACAVLETIHAKGVQLIHHPVREGRDRLDRGQMRIAAKPRQVQRDHITGARQCIHLALPLRAAAQKPVHHDKRCHFRCPCTMRSRVIAQNKIENPAKIPWPTFAYCSASSTSSPRPLAPISDATTTMASDNMMV